MSRLNIYNCHYKMLQSYKHVSKFHMTLRSGRVMEDIAQDLNYTYHNKIVKLVCKLKNITDDEELIWNDDKDFDYCTKQNDLLLIGWCGVF